jgi:hypothetical protein
MRNRPYFSVVACVLLCLAGWAAYGQGQRSGYVRQAWEYKILIWGRHVKYDYTTGGWTRASEDGKALSPFDPGRVQTLAELGNQGWELVSAAPRSSQILLSEPGATIPKIAPGVTTEEVWIFKRPKP